MVSSLDMLNATPAAGGGGVPAPVLVLVSGAGEAVERGTLGNEGVERVEPLF